MSSLKRAAAMTGCQAYVGEPEPAVDFNHFSNGGGW